MTQNFPCSKYFGRKGRNPAQIVSEGDSPGAQRGFREFGVLGVVASGETAETKRPMKGTKTNEQNDEIHTSPSVDAGGHVLFVSAKLGTRGRKQNQALPVHE